MKPIFSSEAQELRTCFVTAPSGVKLDTLIEVLQSRNIRVLAPFNLLVIGQPLSAQLQDVISRVDLIIGVLTNIEVSSNVLFELGFAHGTGKKIILISPPSPTHIPFDLREFLVIRAELDNREAIDFALDQILSAPKIMPHREFKADTTHKLLDSTVDGMLKRLESITRKGSLKGIELEELVKDLLEITGVEVIAESNPKDVRVDFAVWSDAWESYVSNPLLVEVKAHINSYESARQVFERLQYYLNGSNARWALLIHHNDQKKIEEIREYIPPNILVMSIEHLLERLRESSFPQIIRDLRNRRIHGVEN